MTVVSESAPDYYSFETFARFDFAGEVASLTEGYLSRLAVIDPKAADAARDECPTARSVRERAIEIAKMIPVYVEVAGDVDGRVKSALGATLSRQGFRTSDVPQERYALRASLSFDRRDTDSSVQCRYALEGSLEDTSFAETLLPFSISGREASTDFSGAQSRAVKAVEGKIKKEFAQSFSQFLQSIAAY